MKKTLSTLVIMGLIFGAFMAAPAEAKKKKKKAVRTQRVVEIDYTLGNIGAATPAYTGGVCFVDPTMPASCKEVPVMASEKYIKVEVQDSSGTTVPGFISQGDTDGDGISDGYGQFCGAHEAPVQLTSPGTAVGVSMYPGTCADASGGGIPTTGTIKVTLSNMP